MSRTSHIAFVPVIAVTMLLVSCGSDTPADSDPGSTQVDVSVDFDDLDAPIDTNGSEATESTDTPDDTDAPDDTDTPDDTDASGDTPVDGVEFADPEGSYTITPGPEWVLSPSDAVAEGIETWAVAPRADGFTANVNVLTQAVPGVDLAGYIVQSLQDTGEFEVTDQGTVTGTNGNELGVLEYSAMPEGTDLMLRFLAYVDVTDGTANVATFSAQESEFEELRLSVEPFLLTLRPV